MDLWYHRVLDAALAAVGASPAPGRVRSAASKLDALVAHEGATLPAGRPATMAAKLAALGLDTGARPGSVYNLMLALSSRPAVPDVPRAAIVILLGQSLNAPRGTTVQASGGTPGFAKMFVGGASLTLWDFYAVNATHAVHFNDLATTVDYTEGALQSPGAGVLQQLEGGRYSRAYVANVAIGARDLQTLSLTGPLSNAWASLFRLCAAARADGYTPEVLFYSAHGEANAASATTEQAYYDRAVAYYGRLQMYAAQAMLAPGYVAPVLLTYPAQQAQAVGNTGEHDRNIKGAIRRLCVDQPGFYDAGAIYQWPVGADRVHPDPGSYVLRGEHVGRMLRRLTAGEVVAAPLRITGVIQSGVVFTVTFSKPVVRDTVRNVGQSLATGTAEDGLEWFDNGTALAIVPGSLVYSGSTVSGMLASPPLGTPAQQVVRIAEQYTSATLTAGAANLSGSVVRSSESWVSNYGATAMYDFAIPQRITGVS